jgi:ribose transport system substrate-binding protein
MEENNLVAKNQHNTGRYAMFYRLLAVAALLRLAFEVPSAIAAEKTICFVTFSLQVAYFQSSVAGAKKAADELGVKLVVLDPQADAARQVTQVEDCLSRNVNAIVVDPIESSSLLGVIEEAGKRKIPVATLDTPVDSPYVVTLIGVPQREASFTFGQFVAGWITGKLGGKANVGILLASTEVQLARRDGFVDAMKALPGAKIVATGDGRNILERATAEAEDMLTGHPEINVIYATGDPQLQGGLAAAAAQGREIAFFGWDAIPEPFLKPLEEGRIVGFLKQRPEVGGEVAVRLLFDRLNGKEIPKRFTYSPDVVTQFNLDRFR